jgi:hypothetical protein
MAKRWKKFLAVNGSDQKGLYGDVITEAKDTSYFTKKPFKLCRESAVF